MENVFLDANSPELIAVGNYAIFVRRTFPGGTINSNLKANNQKSCANAAIESLEAFILSLVLEGYNPNHPRFLAAIDTRINGIISLYF